MNGSTSTTTQATLPVRRRHRRSALVTVASIAAGGASLLGAMLLTSTAAHASNGISVTATVNIRPGASTSSGNPLGTIPQGTSPNFICWTQGQNINGVDVWFKVTYNGTTGFYASYYDNSSYPTDSAITSKYGIPNCANVQPPAPRPPAPSSSAANGAMSWARSHLGQNYDDGLCLTFVFQAYSAAGVNLRSYVTVPIGNNTYPVDIWGHFNHGTTGGGTPPAGALVFFASKTGNRTLSHVTLSVGGGTMVSTADSVSSPTVHYETLAQHSYANYLGWWMPV